MSDSTEHLDQIEESQVDKEVVANANFAAAAPSMMFGRRMSTTSGLTWGYYGGRFDGTLVNNGTVSLTTASTNYVVVHRTTLVTSVSTSDTNWNDTTTYGRAYRIVAGGSQVVSYEDHRHGNNGILGGAGVGVPAQVWEKQIACSDLATDLTTGVAKAYFRMPLAVMLTDVRASLLQAASAGTVTIDINEGGASILSTKITFDAGEKTSTTAATPPVISDDALADDAEITIDIDNVGSGSVAPRGLIVTLIGTVL